MLIGIVGKPSCGKSTLFKASTLASVDIANYPFTTIKPNHAVGFVKVDDPAKDFGKQSNPRMGYVKKDKRFVPVDLIDVAGLVPDAHKGEGMGAQFLSDLNQADVLIHVIDVSGSTNERGEPVDALSYDPQKDIEFLEKELDFWYLDIMKRGWERFARQVQQEHRDIKKALAKQLSGLGVTEEMVVESISLNSPPTDWTDEELFAIASNLRKLSKPIIIAANKIDVPGAEKNYDRLVKDNPDYYFVKCSAESELALKEADKAGLIEYVPGEDSFEVIGNLTEKQEKALEFIKNYLTNFKSTGVQDLINKAVFGVLERIAIYPGGVSKLEDSDGNVLPDCFLMEKNATALDFAYRLHTDFGKHFIKAIDVRSKMTVGKEHPLKHGDIIEIMSKA